MKLSFFATSLALLVLAITATAANTYYIRTNGSDNNNGLSDASAWQTFQNVNNHTFQPGDNILLRRGDTWTEGMVPGGSGTSGSEILLGYYGSNNSQPTIQRTTQDNGTDERCLDLTDRSHWIVQGIHFYNAHVGVKCHATSTTQSGIDIHDCVFEAMDMDHSSVHNVGTGVLFDGYPWDSINVHACTFNTTSNGIAFLTTFGPPASNITITNCTVYGGWNAGLVLTNVNGATISGLNVHDVGGYSPTGTCGAIAANSDYVTITDSSFSRVSHAGGGDGVGFDFEANDHHCTLTRSYFFENQGAAIDMFSVYNSGSGPQPNIDITISDCLFYNNNTLLHHDSSDVNLFAAVAAGSTNCTGQIVNCGSYINRNSLDHFSDLTQWSGFAISGMIEGTHRTGWIPVYGTMKQVAIGGNGHTWALTTNNRVRSWTGDYLGNCWNIEAGIMTGISAGNDGEVWATDSSNVAWRMNSGSWVQMSTGRAKVAVGSAASIWSIDTARHPSRWNGSGWTPTATVNLIDLDAGPSTSDRPWGVKTTGEVVRYENGSWISKTQYLAQISEGTSSSAAGSDGSHVYLTTDAGANWTQLNNVDAMPVSLGSDSILWGVDSEYHVWRYP